MSKVATRLRNLTVAAAFAGLAAPGILPAQVAAQAEHPFVFYRVCNIEPGQDAAAVALAAAMVDLASRKYPSAQMAARQGRWMTGFQEIAQPVNQILFTEQHPTLADHQDFTDALLDDDEFQALQRKTTGVIDVSSCVDTQFRPSQ